MIIARAFAAALQDSTPDNGFHPTSGGSEMQSGTALLIEAYAAIWIIVLVFVLVMWMRNRALEDRIEQLRAAIRARKAEGAPAAVAAPEEKSQA